MSPNVPAGNQSASNGTTALVRRARAAGRRSPTMQIAIATSDSFAKAAAGKNHNSRAVPRMTEGVGGPFVRGHEEVAEPGAELLRERHCQCGARGDRIVLSGGDHGVEALPDLTAAGVSGRGRGRRPTRARTRPRRRPRRCVSAARRSRRKPSTAHGDRDDGHDRQRVVPRQQRGSARDATPDAGGHLRVVEETQEAVRDGEQRDRERDVDHREVREPDEDRCREPERRRDGAAPRSREAAAEQVEQEGRSEPFEDADRASEQQHIVESTGGAVLGDEPIGVVEPRAVAVGVVVGYDGVRQQRGQRTETPWAAARARDSSGSRGGRRW